MSGHTPGPWVVDDDVVVSKSGITGNIVCEKTNLYASQQFWQANARLIAAAPELLEALKKAEKHCPVNTEAEILARAAIAKAEGKQ